MVDACVTFITLSRAVNALRVWRHAFGRSLPVRHMAFRRPGNWSNRPSAGPPRSYFAPQNAQLSSPANDGYYDESIEEDMGDYMRLRNRSSSNDYTLKMNMRTDRTTTLASL